MRHSLLVALLLICIMLLYWANANHTINFSVLVAGIFNSRFINCYREFCLHYIILKPFLGHLIAFLKVLTNIEVLLYLLIKKILIIYKCVNC